MIIAIWAMDSKNNIGLKNKLPWNIKEEMMHFKKTTINQTILFGRKTFESFNNKTLPNRENIVLTHNKDLAKKFENISNLRFLNNIEDLIKTYYNNTYKDIYICGGLSIYKLFWKYTNIIIFSIIKKEYKGDIKFFDFDLNNWELLSKEEKEEFIIFKYKRK